MSVDVLSLRGRGAKAPEVRAHNVYVDERLEAMCAQRPEHVTYTYREIARYTGLGRGGVWWIEYRALKKIRAWLWRNGFKSEAMGFLKPGGRPRSRA